MLEAATQKGGEALRDWHAVVIGGGMINGISEQNVWPRERMDELMKGEQDLTTRWRQMLVQASEMADNEKDPTGTRYDALRVIPTAGRNARGGQLTKYLQKGVHDELQGGSIRSLGDADAPACAGPLVRGTGERVRGATIGVTVGSSGPGRHSTS